MPRKGPHRYGAYEKAHKDDTADRMWARRAMIREHGEAKARGMDVDHIRAVEGGGAGRDLENLRFRNPRANRADKTY